MTGEEAGRPAEGSPTEGSGEEPPREGNAASGRVAADCEEALVRVYEYLDGELDAETQEKIHRHVEICRRCYPFFNFERIFLDFIAEKGMGRERADRLRDEIRKLLDEG